MVTGIQPKSGTVAASQGVPAILRRSAAIAFSPATPNPGAPTLKAAFDVMIDNL